MQYINFKLNQINIKYVYIPQIIKIFKNEAIKVFKELNARYNTNFFQYKYIIYSSQNSYYWSLYLLQNIFHIQNNEQQHGEIMKDNFYFKPINLDDSQIIILSKTDEALKNINDILLKFKN